MQTLTALNKSIAEYSRGQKTRQLQRKDMNSSVKEVHMQNKVSHIKLRDQTCVTENLEKVWVNIIEATIKAKMEV